MNTPTLPTTGLYIAVDESGSIRAWAGDGYTLPAAPRNFPIGPFIHLDAVRAAIDALPSAPAADIDEAQLARLSERGAVAWAGVTDDDIRALRDGSAPSGEPAEPMTRFCPGCGSVGEVPAKFRDCCPDGGDARVIPAAMAEKCRDLFGLAIDAARATTAPAPLPADTLSQQLQQRCVDWGVYWRASDAHGVDLSHEQALELLRDALGVEVAIAAPLLSNGLTPSETAGKWEGAEEWMPLAWELCADECGEDACTELLWEGGPAPEPWGDRWLKYEDEAKRLIALVRKHVPAAPQAATASVAGLADPQAVPVPAPSEDEEWLRDYCQRPVDPEGEHLPRLRRLLAAKASTAAAAAEPIGYARPEAVRSLQERQAGWLGRADYLLTRTAPEGEYTHPLYAHPAPAVAATVQALTDALRMIAWSNDSAWQAQCAREALDAHGIATPAAPKE